MLHRHRRLSMIKWLSCNGREGIQGQRTHSQKHYAHTSHAHEEKKDLLNHEIKVILTYFMFGSYTGSY